MLLLLAALTHAPSQNPGVMVQRIYAEYRDPNFSPFVQPERYFAPQLLKAIKTDERLAARGSVGYLDFDPLCQCQDPSGLHAQIAKITENSPYAATARIRLRFGPPARPWSSSLRLLLVYTPAGWRIADIASADEPSLLRMLEASNRRQHAKRR
jgi:hypothetical protein